MERIIDVYYDRHGYPFKDRELTARFPVVGSEFLGASQTTTIRFHYEQIGTDENVYTVESKRPDGKTGSQLLSKNTTEHYAEMSLSGWYSECKGDLFLSLKVYRGGTTATYNEETQLWEVNGVPVIESTGAIKLAINYTPMGRYENYNDAIGTYQDVLGALATKLDTIKGIVGISGLSQVDTTEYEEGQLFFDVDTKNIYKLESGEFVKINNKLEIVDVSGQTYQELLDKYGTQPFMSYFEETTNIAVYQFKQNGNDYALYVWTYKNGCLYMPYVDMSAIFSIDDFTNLEYEKAPVITLNNDMGTLSDFELQQVQQPNASLKLGDLYFIKAYEDDNLIEFWHYNVGHISSNSYVGYHNISISKQNKYYRLGSVEELFYDKTKTDQLLNAKQNELHSGTNIKTLTVGNNQPVSLLGSGTINIPTGGSGGDAEWGSIGGDIADQTDLQNEFQEVREIATGRTRSTIISYLKEAPTEQTFSQSLYYDLRGNKIETWSDFVAFVNGRTFANSKFNSQNDDIEIDYDEYIIFDYHTSQTVYRGDEAYEVDTANDYLSEGDIIIVKETTDQQGETIPDRWVYISDQTLVCSKLETSKVNLDNYSTKTETSTEVNKVAHDIAVEYDESTLYGIGDLCIKDKLLYKCNTNDTTGTWDSTKWDLTTVNSELGVIKGNYVKTSDYQSDLTKINNNFAPIYDSTATYSVGDLCIYQGTLYKCITAISTAEAFDSTHWLAYSVKDVGEGLNIIDSSEMTISGNTATLTIAQHNLMLNGKPTRIIGTIFNYTSCTLITNSVGSTINLGVVIATNGENYNIICSFRYNKGTRQLNFNTVSFQFNSYGSVNTISGKGINYYKNNVYPYATNSTTELKYETINNISISADTTFTLANAPSDTYPEYKANITNSGASDITITLQSGTVIKGNVSISSNTFVIPSGSSVELNICNSKAIVVEW